MIPTLALIACNHLLSADPQLPQIWSNYPRGFFDKLLDQTTIWKE
jgi:hypothetical protein